MEDKEKEPGNDGRAIDLQQQMDHAKPNFDGDENFLAGDEWLGVDVDKYRLDFTKQYKQPKYTMSWNGIGFAPLNGIHAITGQSGNGKTMTISQFCAAILGGGYGNLRYELAEEIPNPTVLYIDTEMEEDNTIAFKNRVLTMTNRIVGHEYDDFKILTLREAQSDEKKVNEAVMRWRITLSALYQYRPTVVFIDGLLDVVKDFNDNIECQEIIYKCMQCASHYHTSIWCVVHQNPGGEKLVGHLGSMLERKVTDVIKTVKDKNDTTGDATFTVTQKKARSRDIPDWKFHVIPASGWGIPEQIYAKADDGDSVEIIKVWLSLGRNDITWPAYKDDIKKIFRDRGGVKHKPRQDDDLKKALNRNFIIEQPTESREKGQKFTKYILNPQEFPEDTDGAERISPDLFRERDEEAPF